MISKELNLSTSSVSRALRNDPLIHPETRAEVNTVAARLGYQGRSRRGPRKSGQQRAIRVLFAGNSLIDFKRGAITMSYLQGMTSETEAMHAVLNVQTAPVVGSAARNGGENPSLTERGEGDVLIVIGRHDPDLVARLARNRPVVSLVRSYEGVRHDYIATNDLSGVSQLVARLADFGHRKLAWVSFEDQSSYSRARRAGFLDGCLSSGLDLHDQELIQGIFEDGEVKRPERILKAVASGVTAFVTASDHAAYEVSEILIREGIDIPGEISLTGFDAVGEPGRQSLDFTSYDPNFVELGRAAVRIGLWRLENLSAASLQITVDGGLVAGRTIGPVGAARSVVSGTGRPRSGKPTRARAAANGSPR
jgi:LacI family transcriptional regulator